MPPLTLVSPPHRIRPPRLPVRAPLRQRNQPPRRLDGRAFITSAALHLLLLPFAVWLFGLQRPPPPTATVAPRVEFIELLPFPAAGRPPGASTGGATVPAVPIEPDASRAGSAAASRRGPTLPRAQAGAARSGALPSGGVASSGAADRPQAPGGGSTAAGRGAGVLQPGEWDPRLLVAPRPAPAAAEPTDHDRYMAHLDARLRALNDSSAADADRARRATDWTTTDKSGRRWGISPGQLHLGGVTLPIPVGSPDPGRGDEAEVARQRKEIQRQGEEYDRAQTREERIRATRERKDAERTQQRRSPPDSSGGR